MKTKFRIVYIFIALFLLLSATGMNYQPEKLGPTELQTLARKLVAAKAGVSPQALKLLGKPAIARYPYSGAVLFQYKLYDPINDGFYDIALTRRGVEADVEHYDAAELEAFTQKRGKASPDLWERLAVSRPDEMIEVDIWLKMSPMDSADEISYQKPEVNGESRAGDGMDPGPLEEAVMDRDMKRVQTAIRPVMQYLADVGYASTSTPSAPLVNATLPAGLIRMLGAREDVDTIYLVSPVVPALNTARAVINADDVQAAGYTGAGEKIGMVEAMQIPTGSNPYLTLTRSNPYNCSVGTHATGVAGVIRSTHSTYKGIAPGASLWASCGYTQSELQAAASAGLAWGAETINISWAAVNTGYAPDSWDRFMDRIMFVYNDLVVAAAGNGGAYVSGGNVTSPGRGYNTLTVGNFDDNNTLSWSDDTMFKESSYLDPPSNSGDREKPEVAAPGTKITTLSNAYPWNNYTDNGTSFAAPMVTGLTALMMDRNSSLRMYPESVKAIIMATAIHNIEGKSRLSDKDGAGGIDAQVADYVAINTLTRGRWGSRSYTCSNHLDTIATLSLTAYKRVRFVIVWYQDTDNYSYYTTKPSADIDLNLYKGSALVTSSGSYDNNYEIIDYTPTVTGIYTFQTHNTRCGSSPKYLGWAWYQFP